MSISKFGKSSLATQPQQQQQQQHNQSSSTATCHNIKTTATTSSFGIQPQANGQREKLETCIKDVDGRVGTATHTPLFSSIKTVRIQQKQQQQQQQIANTTLSPRSPTNNNNNKNNNNYNNFDLQDKDLMRELPQPLQQQSEQSMSRLRRPISRSYSALSTTYFKRTPTVNGIDLNIGIDVGGRTKVSESENGLIKINSKHHNQINKTAYAGNMRSNVTYFKRPIVRTINRQRSKSTSSSYNSIRNTNGSSNSNNSKITTKIAANSHSVSTTNRSDDAIAVGETATNVIGAIVTSQPNGICRITRLAKEQEKLPDRINYDRRGLTAIPFFENEPNLRLLSLQHNLINVFNIPRDLNNAKVNKPTTLTTTRSNDIDVGVGNSVDTANDNNELMNNVDVVGLRIGETLLSINQSNNKIRPKRRNFPQFNKQSNISPMYFGDNGQLMINRHNYHIFPIIKNNDDCQLVPQQQSEFKYSNITYLNGCETTTTTTSTTTLAAMPVQILQQNHHQHPEHNQQYRLAFCKSKSFISNYSRHLSNSMKRHMQKTLYQQQPSSEISTNLQQTKEFTIKSLNAKNLINYDSMSLSNVDEACTATATTAVPSITSIGNYILPMSITNNNGQQQHQHQQKHLNQQQQSQQQPKTITNNDIQLHVKNEQSIISYGMIFEHLVFLDLYDNQIHRIANLDGLPALTVLLLGKNRINDISGLMSLRRTLRVLDLHGNKITSISNKINNLHELKSLNLAGNQIRQINQNDFHGLGNLRELNLKRNKIKRINGFHHLLALERLWLCYNELNRVDDMASIAKASNLLEVTIDNNPVSLAGDCASFLISYLPQLQSLSQMPITEQVRRAAMSWRKKKEVAASSMASSGISCGSNQMSNTDVINDTRREEVISNARTNWKLLRLQQTVQGALWGTTVKNVQQKQEKLDKSKMKTETEVFVDKKLQEFVKLPAISKCPNETTTPTPTTTTDVISKTTSVRLSSSSGSSLGPNVDSLSSNYTTENEDSVRITEVEQRHAARAVHETRHKPTTAQDIQVETEPINRYQHQSQQLDQSIEAKATIKKTKAKLNCTEHNVISSYEVNKTVANTDQPNDEEQLQQQQLLPMINKNIKTATLRRNNKNNHNLKDSTSTSVTNSSNNLIEKQQQTESETVELATNCINTKLQQQHHEQQEQLECTNTLAPTASSCIATTISATNKRYMAGNLIRSQTVVGVTNNNSNNNNSISTNNFDTGRFLQQQKPQIHETITNDNNNLNNNASMANNDIAFTTSTRTIGASLKINNNFSSAKTSANNNNNVSATTAAATPIVTASTIATTTPINESEQGGDYLIEISGRYLNIYGQGALRFIDKQWNITKANDVHTLNFSYINFNNIISILPRIKLRFQNAQNYVFRETNINCLGQLNALAELQGITSLFIDSDGNPITAKNSWRQYAIYRLSHWGLKQLNGNDITNVDINTANIMFVGLSDLVLWSMPDIMLQPLLQRLRLDETYTASKLTPKNWLMKTENEALRLVVGKEALQWKKNYNNYHQHHYHPTLSSQLSMVSDKTTPTTATSTSAANIHTTTRTTTTTQNINTRTVVPSTLLTGLSTRERGKIHFALMMENACNAIDKLHRVEELWPTVLLDIVRNTLLDYSQLDVYIRNLMNDLMK